MSKKKRSFRVFPERYGYFPYVFLIYLFLPAYYIAIESSWKMFIGWGLLLLFLISYRQLYATFESKAFTGWLGAQMAIILILALFYSINNIFLGFFTSYFLGWYRRTSVFLLVYALFAAVNFLPFIIYYETLINIGSYYYLIYLIIMFIAPFGIKSMNSRIELEEKLNDANQKIEELVKREERVRIARDLHDTLGHTLSLITLKSQLVSKLAPKDPGRATSEAKEIEKTSRTALTQVRTLVSDMRSTSITEVLAESASILESAGIFYQFKGETNAENIPGVQENILSMCLREAVTNVVKHSGAKNCTVILEQTLGDIQLVIEDDGIGLTGHKGSGNGLRGMSERLELVDGNLRIREKEGTRLTVMIPLIAKDRRAGASS